MDAGTLIISGLKSENVINSIEITINKNYYLIQKYQNIKIKMSPIKL